MPQEILYTSQVRDEKKGPESSPDSGWEPIA